MFKKLTCLLFLIFVLCFSHFAYADTLLPDIVINGARLEDVSDILMHSETLYISPQKASELFRLSLSCDENDIVYTFSNKTRRVTYDTNSGSVNIGDMRSFAYQVMENAYPSFELGGIHYISLRMLCSSLGVDIEYIAQTNTVSITYPDYTAGLFTSDGLAIACKGNNFGIVNAAGEILLPFEYDDISNYDTPSMFKVVDNHRCGIAGREGKLVTDIVYNEIEYVSPGEIYLSIGEDKGMCNIDGRIIVPVEYDNIAYCANLVAMVKRGSKWYVLDCSTNTLSDKHFDEVYEITEGIQTDNHMIKGYYALRNGKWGCIDSFGNTVIEFRYEALDKFDEMGRARVIYNGKFGIVDCGGQIIIPTAYDYIYPFGKLKVAVAQVGSKYGALNLDGSIAIPFEYDYLYSFNNSRTTVAYKDGMFSILNLDGTNATDKTYRYIEEFKNGIALAYGEGYGYIDHSGNEIIKCIHSEVKQGTALSVFLKKDGKWALFSPNGENMTGFIYNDAGAFENGLSAVSISSDGSEKYGYVNDSGDVIIPFKYSTAQKFKYGKAIVSLGSSYGIIDIEGNTLIPFDYTGFNPSYDYNVIAAADKNSKWGLISFTNKSLTNFAYDYIFEFENGYAAVLQNHKYGVIDTNGKLKTEIKYKTAAEALAAISKKPA